MVALQAGEAEARRVWGALIAESIRHMNAVFGQLGVLLTDDDLRPESFYNAMLPGVCAALEAQGIARVSDGALCVFEQGDAEEVGRDGDGDGEAEGGGDGGGGGTPLIVRKSDGGYGYATTDLAAVKYRAEELGMTRGVYVVDARQRDHFHKVFDAAARAGWLDGGGVKVEHVAFGTVLGPGRKPFKTREGGAVKLIEVLNEAVERAEAVVAAKNPDLPAEERKSVARAVGIGAVKYADLSNDRVKDYVFDWDRMLAMEGNTAPYLMYSYTRVQSIFRKVAEMSDGEAVVSVGETVTVSADAERALVLKLVAFGGALESVAQTLEPHRWCTYLYEVATLFHRFYEQCPVLKAEDAVTRAERLALCALTGRVLSVGLGLLGIDVVERM